MNFNVPSNANHPGIPGSSNHSSSKENSDTAQEQILAFVSHPHESNEEWHEISGEGIWFLLGVLEGFLQNAIILVLKV